MTDHSTTGGIYWSNAKAYARVRLGKGCRPNVALPTCSTQDEADARLAVLARLAANFREAGLEEKALPFLKKAAAATTEAELDAVEKLAGRYCAGTWRPDASPLLPAPILRWPTVGGVYFVRADDRVKIGKAENVDKRLRGLQTSAPHRLELLAIAPGGLVEEAAYHARFAEERLHGEWFRLSRRVIAHVADLRGAKSLPRSPTPPPTPTTERP